MRKISAGERVIINLSMSQLPLEVEGLGAIAILKSRCWETAGLEANLKSGLGEDQKVS